MMRRFAVLVAVACVGLGIPAVAASANPLPDLTCGPITRSVKLREDLTCPNGVQVVDADEGAPALPAQLTIDLNGHTLTTPPITVCPSPDPTTCSSIYVSAQHTAVNIRNGTVSGNIVYADGNARYTVEQPAMGGVVSNVHAESGVTLGGRNGTLRDSSVARAVFVGGFGDARLAHNVIQQGVGVEGGATIDHNIIFGGIEGDDFCGFVCGPGLTVTDNLLVGAPAAGISFDVTVFNSFVHHIATISGNVITKATGAGISLSTPELGSYTVTNNLLLANGGDGLELSAVRPPFGPPVPPETLTGNVAIANGGQGFNLQGAPTAFTLTARNNTAFANRTNPQCTGIICRP